MKPKPITKIFHGNSDRHWPTLKKSHHNNTNFSTHIHTQNNTNMHKNHISSDAGLI